MQKIFITSLILTILSPLYAIEIQEAYYGQEFSSIISQESNNTINKNSSKLKQVLNYALNGGHIATNNNFDQIIDYCGSTANCYEHNPLEYSDSRLVIFVQLDSVKIGNDYYVEDVYCEETIRLPKKNGVPKTPHSNNYNIEHTWPKSRFSKGNGYSYNYQLSDMHHLFPSHSQANSKRANYFFADFYDGEDAAPGCPSSQYKSTHQGKRFMPPAKHKGNVARALFYMSTKYELKINPQEEETLRRWHEEDPVDATEIARNNKIFSVQYTRNPFIDYPNIVNLINDF